MLKAGHAKLTQMRAI